MIILTKVVLVMMVSMIVSILLGLILIPVLKKLKANQRLSEYLSEKHKSKVGTPTMGGLIFIFSTLFVFLIMYILKKIRINSSLIIVEFIVGNDACCQSDTTVKIETGIRERVIFNAERRLYYN